MSTLDRVSAPRVLYVDDEEMTRALFVRELGSRGFAVTTASGGLAGLRECESQRFDLVVSDLRMPQLDGLALLRELRDHQISIPFILTTAVPELDSLRLDPQVFDVVPKPWDADHLHERCRAAIASCEGGSTETTRILLLEDNPADLEIIQFYLEEAHCPYELIPARTLEEAGAILQENPLELIISDLKLSDAHGLAVVEKLRRMAPDAAILIASGSDDEDLAVRAIALGAQDFFVKGHIRSLTLQRSLRFALERKRTERRLAHLAHYDELTGLANRKRMRSRLVEAISRANRAIESFGVVYIDLDGFKPINDRYGHEAGDAVLETVARRMRQVVREYDAVARLGGDEFAVLLEPPCNFSGAIHVMERLLASVREPISVVGGQLDVSASLGLAMFPQDGDAPEVLIRIAEENMYAAQKAGGSRFTTSVESQRDDGAETLASRLGRAVANDEFTLVFQPQIETQSGHIVGVEALLRWDPADGDGLAPSEFVPALEQTGLIVDVGAWVIRETVRQLAAWDEAGLPPLEGAVNVSSRQFERGDLADVVEEALAEGKVSASRLHLEFDESTLMRNTRATNAALSALKKLGVRLVIDDFGTGYSSLAYLHRFEVDILKIDQAFVKDLGASPEGDAVTAAIIGLGKQLGLTLVAKGVENTSQLNFVSQRECDRVQGFHFSEAVTPERVKELLSWESLFQSGVG